MQTFGEKIGLNKYKEETEVRGQRRLSKEQRHRIQGPRWAHQARLESKRPQLAEKRRPSSYCHTAGKVWWPWHHHVMLL